MSSINQFIDFNCFYYIRKFYIIYVFNMNFIQTFLFILFFIVVLYSDFKINISTNTIHHGNIIGSNRRSKITCFLCLFYLMVSLMISLDSYFLRELILIIVTIQVMHQRVYDHIHHTSSLSHYLSST